MIPNASSIPPQILNDTERAAMRARYAAIGRRVIAFFGFAWPHKRVERLFDIADPARDHLVLICDLDRGDAYHRSILERAEGAPWAGRVTVTGFLPAVEAGRLMASADAVVLPFESGGGLWNTSLHAAMSQGTFVLTTSDGERGFDPARNIHYSPPDDLAGMRAALAAHAGRRNAAATALHARPWDEIADAHLEFYARFLPGRPRGPAAAT
jgi:glycosyltransferase involved in cell wall biosynthesis